MQTEATAKKDCIKSMGKGVIAFIRATGIYYDSRTIKEIKALVEGGYKVEVIGWDRTGQALEKCREVFLDEKDQVNFTFFDLRITDIGLRLDKLLKWGGFIKKTLKYLHKNKRLFAIHSCDLDTGLSSQKFAEKNQILFVYDIFDYYSDSHRMPNMVRKIVSYIENRVVNKADLTIICTEGRKEQINKAKPEKLLVIHNSPDLDYDGINVEKEFDYIYFGCLDDGRLIKEKLEIYPEHQNLKIGFGGYGKYVAKCQELEKEYSNFSYLGIVSYSGVLNYEKRAKCMSAIYDPAFRNHRLCAPNKFYESLAIGIPIIVCKGTGIDQIVLENGLGKVIGYNADEFYNAVEDLIKNPDQCRKIGKKSRALYDRSYRWRFMKEKLLKAYENLRVV